MMYLETVIYLHVQQALQKKKRKSINLVFVISVNMYVSNSIPNNVQIFTFFSFVLLSL